jgi:hypothetical protein
MGAAENCPNHVYIKMNDCVLNEAAVEGFAKRMKRLSSLKVDGVFYRLGISKRRFSVDQDLHSPRHALILLRVQPRSFLIQPFSTTALDHLYIPPLSQF